MFQAGVKGMSEQSKLIAANVIVGCVSALPDVTSKSNHNNLLPQVKWLPVTSRVTYLLTDKFKISVIWAGLSEPHLDHKVLGGWYLEVRTCTSPVPLLHVHTTARCIIYSKGHMN